MLWEPGVQQRAIVGAPQVFESCLLSCGLWEIITALDPLFETDKKLFVACRRFNILHAVVSFLQRIKGLELLIVVHMEVFLS